MMQYKAALVLWLDIHPEMRAECDEWYVRRHIADRIAVPGWNRIRRYQAVAPTKPATMALYEIDSAESLVSDEYLRLQRNVDSTDVRMRSTFSNVARETFLIDYSKAIGEGGVMVSLRFHPGSAVRSGEDGESAFANDIIGELTTKPGVVGMHLLRPAPELRDVHDMHRKSGSADARVDWVLFVETAGAEQASAVETELRRWCQRHNLHFNEAELGVYDLTYAVRAAS